MLNATIEGGTVLAYPNFLDTLNAIRPAMLFRILGGGLYLISFIIGAYNLLMTMKSGAPVNGSIEVYVEEKKDQENMGLINTFFNPPVLYSLAVVTLLCLWVATGGLLADVGFVGTLVVSTAAVLHFRVGGAKWIDWYERLLANAIPFAILTLVAVGIGGAVQIIPTVTMQRAQNMEGRLQIPYTPLELAGRDIYISEGCYNCHSQMIRTLVPDVLRYGPYSELGESIYDYPYQWGSRRTGPDLAREGGLRGDDWHYFHMMDPRQISEGSNMPAYPWMADKDTNINALPSKIKVMKKLGVPYPDWSDEEVIAEAQQQAEAIAANLKILNVYLPPEKEMIALIAYLQKLGQAEEPATETLQNAAP